MVKLKQIELREQCLVCGAKVFSRAAHYVYCPKIMEDVDPAELRAMEEKQNQALLELARVV